MEVLEFLLNRHSTPKLTTPGPSADEISLMLQAASRAPDHGGLKPWEFVVVSGEGRNKLGELFQQAAIADEMPLPQQARAASLPLRAPVVVVVIAKVSEHPKVPRIEQVQSAGCAVLSMQQAALAMGYGGIWRTGAFATSDTVRQGFSMNADDELVGFLYLGSADCTVTSNKNTDISDQIHYWD